MADPCHRGVRVARRVEKRNRCARNQRHRGRRRGDRVRPAGFRDDGTVSSTRSVSHGVGLGVPRRGVCPVDRVRVGERASEREPRFETKKDECFFSI